MISTRNCVKTAIKSMTKKRTTTGHAVLIAVNGVTQCGGVVVRTRRPLPAANSRSISQKTMSRKATRKKQRASKKRGVLFAKRTDIRQVSVIRIRT